MTNSEIPLTLHIKNDFCHYADNQHTKYEIKEKKNLENIYFNFI